jgi:chromosome partitioning protein
MIKIVCAGQKGGVGKSTVARALAVGLAKGIVGKKRSVVLADLDSGQRTIGEWAAARDRNGLDPSVHVEVVDIHTRGFSVPNTERADVLIYDCPGWSDEHTRMAAGIADLVILPTGPGQDDLRPLVRLCYELEEAGIDANRIAITLIRTHTDAEVAGARDYLAKADLKAVDGDLREAAAMTKSHSVGQCALELPGEKQRSGAEALIKAIIKQLNKVGEQPISEDTVDWESMDWSFVANDK